MPVTVLTAGNRTPSPSTIQQHGQTNLANKEYPLHDDWIPAFQNLTGQRDHQFYLMNDKRQKIILKAVSVAVGRLLYVEALD